MTVVVVSAHVGRFDCDETPAQTQGGAMAKFSASEVEPISWDVQNAPKIDPDTGELDGKWASGEQHSQGTLAEPTHEQVKAYTDSWDHVHERIRDAKRAKAKDEELFDEIRTTLTEQLINVGFPEQLVRRLPPRQFRALCDHVYQELVTGEA